MTDLEDRQKQQRRRRRIDSFGSYPNSRRTNLQGVNTI